MYLALARSDFCNFGVTLLMALLILFALFQFPVIYIDLDSIGIFDFYVIFLFVCVIIRSIYRPLFNIRDWEPLFFIIVANICYYFLRLDYYALNDFKILLILKYIEHFFLFFVIVYFLENEKINFKMLIKFIKMILLILALFQIYEFVMGFTKRYRVGMPFTLGVSSNPAGFVLGTAIIFYIEYVLKKKPRPVDIVIFVCVCISFLLTLSRTNFLGILAAYSIYYFIKGFKHPKRLIISIIIIVLLALIIYGSAFFIANSTGRFFAPLKRFAVIILNPDIVLADQSFQIRYIQMWPLAINYWLESEYTFFFGKGLAFIAIVDGTIPNLLCNQGLIGALFFLYIWIVFYLRRYHFPVMWILMIFLLINSLNADTLIVSYRSIQAYVVFLILIIYYHRQELNNGIEEHKLVMKEQR